MENISTDWVISSSSDSFRAKGWRKFIAVIFGVAVCGSAFWMGKIGSIATHFGQFLMLYAILWVSAIAYLVAIPKAIGSRTLLFWILIPTVLTRLFLFPMPVSDDINRYLWEGSLVSQGGNPYTTAPDHPSLSHLRDEYWTGINHNHMTAIYPPVALLIFSAISSVFHSAAFYKLVFILFDMGIVALLLLLLKERGIHRRWSLLYALSPVALLGFAGQAHYDSVMIFWLMAALYAYQKKAWLWMYIALSLVFQTKYVGFVVLPFLVNRENWKSAWALLPGCIVPFIFFSGEGLAPIFRSLSQFGFSMAHNGSIHGIFRVLTGNIQTATVLCMLLLAFFMVWLWRQRHLDGIKRASMALMGLLLLAPTVHFWYIAWLVPLICFYPRWSLLALGLTASLYFTADLMEKNMGIWFQPAWVTVLQWLPVYFFMIFEYRRFRMFQSIKHTDKNPETISIIIPVLNASKHLPLCLDKIKALKPGPGQIIVSDGGSTDGSTEIAEKTGARVIHSKRGRGFQITEGVKASSGDICVIVHADTKIESGTITQIRDAFRHNPYLAGGAFGQRFETTSLALSFIELLNDFRASLLGIAFGDQVQFFRREWALKNKSVPEIPLMEDVELSFRLRNSGEWAYMWGSAEVSNYKWDSGFITRFALVIRLMSSYLWRKWAGKDETADLYRVYYE